jgi:hypothetical protein
VGKQRSESVPIRQYLHFVAHHYYRQSPGLASPDGLSKFADPTVQHPMIDDKGTEARLKPDSVLSRSGERHAAVLVQRLKLSFSRFRLI